MKISKPEASSLRVYAIPQSLRFEAARPARSRANSFEHGLRKHPFGDALSKPMPDLRQWANMKRVKRIQHPQLGLTQVSPAAFGRAKARMTQAKPWPRSPAGPPTRPPSTVNFIAEPSLEARSGGQDAHLDAGRANEPSRPSREKKGAERAVEGVEG